jgi:hypothetical protein
MKTVVLVVLLTAAAFAQVPPASPEGCGSEHVSFKVNLDESQHALAQPEPGKARVYFIHDAGTGSTLGYPTVKVAMDGAWLGANHGNSYFSVSAEPGEHHVCITLQSSLVAQRVELAHFTAAADTIYYFRTRLVLSRAIDLLELEAIDSDQGKYLIATFPLAVSHPKK